METLARNTAYLTAASIGQKALAFAYFAVLARALGVADTGAYFLALSLTTMVGVLADFGLTPMLIRETAKRPAEAQTLLSTILGAKLILFLIAAVATCVLTWALGYEDLTRTLIGAAVLVMALDTVHLTYWGVFRGRQRLGFESVGVFIGQLCTLAAGGMVLLTHASPLWLVMALAIGSLWNVLFSGFWLYRIGLKPWRLEWSWERTRHLLVEALPFAMAAIFVKVYSSVDTLLLAHIHGELAVGYYSIAYKLTYAFQFLPLAFVAALYPQFSELIGQQRREELQRTFTHAMFYMALIAVPISLGLATSASVIVPLVYGAGYLPAVAVLEILALVLLFIFLDYPIGSLLNADHRQRTKTAIMGGTMVLNIGANLILIPRIGLLGAPIAAVIGFAWLLGAGLVAVQTSVPLQLARLAKRLAPIFLSGVVMALVVLFSKHVLGLLVIPLGAVVYLCCLSLTSALSLQDIRRFLKHRG